MAIYEGARAGMPGGLPSSAYPSNSAPEALSNMNLTDPSVYMQSARDLADYNTQSSQALAREQMAFQNSSNAKAMAFNASEAQKVRDWQTMMSNTAHVREVRDLLEAGLNPILSANNGAAVGSSPAGSISGQSGAKGAVDTSAMSALVNAYTQAKQIEMQERSIDAQLAMNELSNATTRYAADKGAYGAISAAGLNSSAQRYNADTNKWIYEQGYHGIDSVTGNQVVKATNQVSDQIQQNTGSARSLSEYIFGKKGVNDFGTFVKDLFSGFTNAQMERANKRPE